MYMSSTTTTTLGFRFFFFFCISISIRSIHAITGPGFTSSNTVAATTNNPKDFYGVPLTSIGGNPVMGKHQQLIMVMPGFCDHRIASFGVTPQSLGLFAAYLVEAYGNWQNNLTSNTWGYQRYAGYLMEYCNVDQTLQSPTFNLWTAHASMTPICFGYLYSTLQRWGCTFNTSIYATYTLPPYGTLCNNGCLDCASADDYQNQKCPKHAWGPGPPSVPPCNPGYLNWALSQAGVTLNLKMEPVLACPEASRLSVPSCPAGKCTVTEAIDLDLQTEQSTVMGRQIGVPLVKDMSDLTNLQTICSVGQTTSQATPVLCNYEVGIGADPNNPLTVAEAQTMITKGSITIQVDARTTYDGVTTANYKTVSFDLPIAYAPPSSGESTTALMWSPVDSLVLQTPPQTIAVRFFSKAMVAMIQAGTPYWCCPTRLTNSVGASVIPPQWFLDYQANNTVISIVSDYYSDGTPIAVIPSCYAVPIQRTGRFDAEGLFPPASNLLLWPSATCTYQISFDNLLLRGVQPDSVKVDFTSSTRPPSSQSSATQAGITWENEIVSGSQIFRIQKIPEPAGFSIASNVTTGKHIVCPIDRCELDFTFDVYSPIEQHNLTHTVRGQNITEATVVVQYPDPAQYVRAMLTLERKGGGGNDDHVVLPSVNTTHVTKHLYTYNPLFARWQVDVHLEFNDLLPWTVNASLNNTLTLGGGDHQLLISAPYWVFNPHGQERQHWALPTSAVNDTNTTMGSFSVSFFHPQIFGGGGAINTSTIITASVRSSIPLVIDVSAKLVVGIPDGVDPVNPYFQVPVVPLRRNNPAKFPRVIITNIEDPSLTHEFYSDVATDDAFSLDGIPQLQWKVSNFAINGLYTGVLNLSNSDVVRIGSNYTLQIVPPFYDGLGGWFSGAFYKSYPQRTFRITPNYDGLLIFCTVSNSGPNAGLMPRYGRHVFLCRIATKPSELSLVGTYQVTTLPSNAPFMAGTLNCTRTDNNWRPVPAPLLQQLTAGVVLRGGFASAHTHQICSVGYNVEFPTADIGIKLNIAVRNATTSAVRFVDGLEVDFNPVDPLSNHGFRIVPNTCYINTSSTSSSLDDENRTFTITGPVSVAVSYTGPATSIPPPPLQLYASSLFPATTTSSWSAGQIGAEFTHTFNVTMRQLIDAGIGAHRVSLSPALWTGHTWLIFGTTPPRSWGDQHTFLQIKPLQNVDLGAGIVIPLSEDQRVNYTKDSKGPSAEVRVFASIVAFTVLLATWIGIGFLLF